MYYMIEQEDVWFGMQSMDVDEEIMFSSSGGSKQTSSLHVTVSTCFHHLLLALLLFYDLMMYYFLPTSFLFTFCAIITLEFLTIFVFDTITITSVAAFQLFYA